MATNFIQGSDGHYFLASNLTLSSFTYDISHTHMLSCGFRGHKEAPFAASDVSYLSAALVESGLLQSQNLRLCREDGECTSEVLRSAFRAKAQRVGENGAFLFSYHGPAVACGTSYSLVSSNFRAHLPDTHITGATILQWVAGLEVKPRQILCFLDCPFASEIATILTGPPTTTHIEKLCVFCANTPSHSPFLTTPLQHSMFTYFAAWAFKTHTKRPELPVQRLIYVKDIGRKIKECCSALNFLCVSETQDTSTPAVLSVQLQPLLLRFVDDRNGHDMIDGETDEEEEEGEDLVDGEVARFTFLEKHYRARGIKTKPKLCDLGHRWLQGLKHCDASSLHVLHRHGVLTCEEMRLSVLRLLLYSLALIQASSLRKSVEEPNFLIMLFVQVMGVIEHVASSAVVVGVQQFEPAFEAYCHALKHRQASLTRVCELAGKVKKETTIIK